MAELPEILNGEAVSPEVAEAKRRFGILGNAPALNAAVQRAVRVAPIDLSVLVTGESGTGKEFFPKIIHWYGARKHAPYIAVNCGAIPEGTIDSELFGHEKGSFTGAVASRKGYFEEADGGTIFLDEVAELPLTTQARLLRVLESGEFLKVGSSTVQKTNIRIVAATNVDLSRAIADGRFREDLYYRLSTVQIAVPALHTRGADILLLARKFATDFAERYSMPVITFDDDARNELLRYRWPGNVRQLKNVVEQLSLFEAGNEVSPQDIAQYLPAGSGAFTPTRPALEHTYEREREMLFNMIFTLRQRLDALQERLDDHNFTPSVEVTPSNRNSALPTLSTLHRMASASAESPVNTTKKTSKTTVVSDPEADKNAVRQALERNDGRRKAAAAELGITERVLYRKIHEYGLE